MTDSFPSRLQRAASTETATYPRRVGMTGEQPARLYWFTPRSSGALIALHENTGVARFLATPDLVIGAEQLFLASTLPLSIWSVGRHVEVASCTVDTLRRVARSVGMADAEVKAWAASHLARASEMAARHTELYCGKHRAARLLLALEQLAEADSVPHRLGRVVRVSPDVVCWLAGLSKETARRAADDAIGRGSLARIKAGYYLLPGAHQTTTAPVRPASLIAVPA